MEFEHPDYKGSSLFKRPNRMKIKINLTKIKTDLKLILNLSNKQLLKSKMNEETRDGDNHLTINLHFLESATFMS